MKMDNLRLHSFKILLPSCMESTRCDEFFGCSAEHQDCSCIALDKSHKEVQAMFFGDVC